MAESLSMDSTAFEKIRQAKFDINLAEYVQQYGYEISCQKSTATDVILQKKDGDTTLDTIGVRYYADTGYKYWTAMDSSDKGSLLDFEKNKNHLDFTSSEGKKELYRRIDDYLGNVSNSLPIKASHPKTAVPTKALSDRELNLLPLTDTRYLESRGITAATYQSPEFQFQVYNEKVVLHGKTYTNTVFPIRNEDVLLAKIRRNDEEKGYRGGQFNRVSEKRENGIHTSNFPSDTLNKLYLVESPIDAMSYFELKSKEIRERNERVAFISTIGNPSNSAFNTIQKFINASQPKQIISLMDNDRAGRVFTINLMGKLSKPNIEQSQHIQAEINVSQKTEATLSIHFSYDNEAKRQEMATALKSQILEPLHQSIIEGSDAQIKIATIIKSANYAHLEIKFPYGIANLITVEKGLAQIKGLNQEFLMEYPIQKDWNDELKRQKPYIVTVGKNGVELPEKRFTDAIEAHLFIESKNLEQIRVVRLYHEKYNRSHEVDAPQVLLKIKYGEVLEIDGKFQSEIEKYLKEKELKERIKKEKLLAIQLSKSLFPNNESNITKTTYQSETQQHFIEFHLINSSDKLESQIGIHPSFSEKINQNSIQSHVIAFNNKTDSVHLMIPELKESCFIEGEFVGKCQRELELIKNEIKESKTEIKVEHFEAFATSLNITTP